MPRRRSTDNDHRLVCTPHPPSLWACAVGGCHPPQMLHRQRPPIGQGSPSTQPVHLRHWGLPSPAALNK